MRQPPEKLSLLRSSAVAVPNRRKDLRPAFVSIFIEQFLARPGDQLCAFARSALEKQQALPLAATLLQR
jgi:hypothetical protein